VYFAVGGGTVADGDGGSGHRPSESLDVMWAVPGGAAGLAAFVKILNGTNLRETPLLMEAGAFGGLTAGGGALFWHISERLREEVRRGVISYATYWTTMFGITVAVFALLGVTSIDGLLALRREP